MQWGGPGRGMRPPPYVTNSQPVMRPFDGGRGFTNDMDSMGRAANLIVVPTRCEHQRIMGLCVLFVCLFVCLCVSLELKLQIVNKFAIYW